MTEALPFLAFARYVAEEEKMVNRRDFCTLLGGSAMMALVDNEGLAQEMPAATSVPYSAGTDSPKLRAPAQCLRRTPSYL